MLAVPRPDRRLALLLAAILANLSPAAAQAPADWPRHAIDQSYRGADGVRLGDFNGDGKLDLVTGWEESGLVRLYLNPGPERARHAWPAVIVGRADSPEDAVPVDLDLDGHLDVLSCHEGRVEQVIVHWNDRSRTAQRLLEPSYWRSEPIEALAGQKWMFALPIGRLNGRTMVVVGSKGKDASITLLLGPVAGSRDLNDVRATRLRDAGWIMSLRSLDMDDDGDPDVVFSDRKGAARGIGWLENPGAAGQSWAEHSIGGEDHEVLFLAAQRDRILAATRQGKWLEYVRRGERDWVEQVHPNPKDVPWGKAIEPLGDARVVMTANTNHAKDARVPGIWLRQHDSWNPIDPTPRVKFDRLERIDLDGDGDLDLVTCEERQNLGVVWYENPGRSKSFR